MDRGDHTESDIMVVPCHMKETSIAGNMDNIRDDCVRDPEAVFEYLTNMATVAWYNFGTFKYADYDKSERIAKQSSIISYKTKEKEQTWRAATLHLSELNDEIDFFQWGQIDNIEIEKFVFGSNFHPSSFKDWPTESEPNNRYKISSLVINLDSNVSIIERSTYSCLEWLGDIGGLYDAMQLIGRALAYPIDIFALNVELVT